MGSDTDYHDPEIFIYYCMPSDSDKTRTGLQQRVLTATTYFLHVIGAAAVLYQEPTYWKQPYHTSALSGHWTAWVEELMNGHPDRIFHELDFMSSLHLWPLSDFSVGLIHPRRE